MDSFSNLWIDFIVIAGKLAKKIEKRYYANKIPKIKTRAIKA